MMRFEASNQARTAYYTKAWADNRYSGGIELSAGDELEMSWPR